MTPPTAEVKLDRARRRVARCLQCRKRFADDGTEAWAQEVANHLRSHRAEVQLPGFEAELA